MYPLIGVLLLVMTGLAIYGQYQINFAADPIAYSCIPSEAGNLPRDDIRGAFLQLKPGADPRCPSNLWQLLELTESNVVPTDKMLPISGAAIEAVIINQASIDADMSSYLVYATGQPPLALTTQRLREGRLLRLQPKSGGWDTGNYQIDIPSGGMFDNSRLYYAFAVTGAVPTPAATR
jgi:hypothetical protein